MDTTKTEPLTDEMITTLSTESGAAGDAETTAYCVAALEGDDAARAVVASAITDARAMDEATPFVRVVA